MKKQIFFIVAVACLSCLFEMSKVSAQRPALTQYFAGNGTSYNPYQITNVTDLQNLSLVVYSGYGDSINGRCFKLMNDIDMTGIGWTPIGRLDYNNPLSYCFRGHFDGNGKVIRNLTCITSGDDINGLFHTLDGATVENLGIENCNMTSNNIVGGLAGCSLRNTYISNCCVTGNVKGTRYTGGLVGYASSCTFISNCYFSGNVSAVNQGGSLGVGGLVGYYVGICIGGDGDNNGLYHSIISNCYVTGKVSGMSAPSYTGYLVGGLIGALGDGIVRNCVVAVDSITSNMQYINRIAGGAYFGVPPMLYAIGAILQNNYALNTMVVQDGNGNVPIVSNLNTEYGMSIPIDSLKSFTFYNDWNNWYASPWSIDMPSGVWKICDKQDLPFLRWQGIVCYYDITSSAGANGSISPQGTSSVVENTNKTFIFTPNTCYETDSLWIDGVYAADSIAKGSYTFNNIAKNHTIKASFKKIKYFTPIADITCSNTPYAFGKQTLTSTGIYYDTVKNVNGCDSIIELTLTVNPVGFTQINDTICEGDIYDFHGKTLNLADIYYDTLQTIHNCDSVIELNLTVVHQRFTQINDTICEGDIYDFHGKTLSLADIYYDTLQTIHNCDSVIELTLTVTTDVGVKQLRIENYELRVYPNPVKNQLQITNYELRENTYIQIYSVVGQLVYQINNLPNQQQITKSTNNQISNITIDISHLGKGMYYLKVGNRVARFVKE